MKAYWVDFSKVVPYGTDPSHKIFAYKFLYWEEEGIILICGSEMPSHSDICKEARSVTPKKIPDGAGKILNGQIVDWESIGFNIITPTKFRGMIAEKLGFDNIC